MLPEPFVGHLDAPVVLLALNPGVSDGDFALHKEDAFQRRVRACNRQDCVDWATTTSIRNSLAQALAGLRGFSARSFENSAWLPSQMVLYSSNTFRITRAASGTIG